MPDLVYIRDDDDDEQYYAEMQQRNQRTPRKFKEKEEYGKEKPEGRNRR